ncbi:helix-turn-helix transcriptional regulator [Endozoicomonas sp. SM1973]|uniref:Helix-turn-helix transcriptional regulator n=1 Tax=Spartinivicinus marinus TaxID=2994442 RepID=A0A853ICL1_9GAMM|nr:helix-turn-helix transcriptional regulator [Spartinivicinus marinus]MCX4030161.1 hypothetical protein [Spartinivicinus marinus]NYZ67804.1 helix-turn-helix transcriptional regulator [Spartinivicinus marinus]
MQPKKPLEELLSPDLKEKLDNNYYKGVDQESFAKRVSLLIEIAGNASNLGESTNLSGANIRKWARGESEPTRENIIKLSAFGHVSLKWLIKGEDPIYDESLPIIPKNLQLDALKKKVSAGTASFSYLERDEILCCIEKFNHELHDGPYAIKLRDKLEVRNITIINDFKCRISKYEWSNAPSESWEISDENLKEIIIGRIIWFSKILK